MVDVYDEDFNEDDLNEINDIKNEGMFDEEEALIEENENSPSSSSSDGDSNNDKRFPVEEPIDWIHWFCKLKGNEYFVEVDENFIKKEENLEGIKTKNFLKVILSEKNTKDFDLTKELLEELQDIREIYGYIHKRFINTPEGLGLMREKFINGVFGYCPRMLCNKQVVLPVGLSEDMRYSQVKVFCPLCQEVYKPRDIFYGYSDKKIIKFDLPDGVFFGTSFPQTFLMHFPDLDPRINAPLRYIPKLYGFRIFGKYGSKYYSENKEELKKNLLKFNIINN
jgi:casein kinase II subunit beta